MPDFRNSPPGQSPSSSSAPVAVGWNSHWNKICERQGTPEQTCSLGEASRSASGILIAMLFERRGQSTKLLRFTLPLGVQLKYGMRFAIDQEAPVYAPYVTCVQTGCIADFSVGTGFVSKLENGRALGIQGVDASNNALTLMLPLESFRKAYEGPPMSADAMSSQLGRLQSEQAPTRPTKEPTTQN